ncbi:multicopper oxidase domain-containing protein [Streptomyces anulatus]|uniref:multicopper oxidase domain-containing protein n=1 Tax=Streptomyces anulatus TaxID=1892 RepID=UPI003D800632
MEKTRGRRRLNRVLITLAVPPLAPSTVDKDGTRVFDLRMADGEDGVPPGRGDPDLGVQRRPSRPDAAGGARRKDEGPGAQHARRGLQRGRKDTVAVAMGSTVRIALRFDGPSDPDTPYMYHCHLLSHEDEGMMGQFVVVDEGQRAGAPPGHAGH